VNSRTATVALCALDAAAWAFVVGATVMSGSDPATIGLDRSAGMAVTALFLATGTPAIVLAWRNRAPTAALMLALAFPVALALAFVVAVVAFA
jgi:hypothetical protein